MAGEAWTFLLRVGPLESIPRVYPEDKGSFRTAVSLFRDSRSRSRKAIVCAYDDGALQKSR